MAPLRPPPRSRRGPLARMASAAAVVCALTQPSMLVRAAPFSICATVQTCSKNGALAVCDPHLEKCPPCVYPNAAKFNCYDYDKEARTTQCPFLSVNTDYIDCSNATNWAKWSTPATANSMNTTATNMTVAGNTTSNATRNSIDDGTSTSSSTSNSKLVLIAGIGVGVLVLLVIVIAICKRRKRQPPLRRNTAPLRHMARGSSKRVKTKHDEAFGSHGGGAYNQVETTKNGNGNAFGSYQQQRKLSDPVVLLEETADDDASRDSDAATYMSHVPTDEALSVDGMLGDAPLTPVVLGGHSGRGQPLPPPHPSHRHQSQQRQSQHHTGNSVGQSKSNAFASVNDLVTQDISIRCTASANVFDEYLRMKQEMQYDHDVGHHHIDHDDDGMSEVMSEMSDYDSDTMSLSKFSLEASTHNVGPPTLARHDGGLSITDSEYDEHLRNRGASECFSEMSYNDEKYSFSEDDDMGVELARSKGGGNGSNVPDREVEI